MYFYLNINYIYFDFKLAFILVKCLICFDKVYFTFMNYKLL